MALSSRTVSWIESLVAQEIEIASGDRLSIDIVTAKESLLIQETVQFSRTLFGEFKELAGFLNRRLPANSSILRVSRLADDGAEFLVEREPLRLTFRAQSGVVNFMCEKNPNRELQFGGSIEAKFGAFYDLDWLFLGKVVSAEQVARHYLTEIVQATNSLRH